MKARAFITLIVLLFGISSCASSQDVIRPGESIGPVRIGADVATKDFKAYQASLKDLGLMITTEAGAKIGSVTTTNPKYALNGNIQVGLSVSELLKALGNPYLVDGLPYDGSDLCTTSRGFFAYKGLVIGINEGKIAFITVVPAK